MKTKYIHITAADEPNIGIIKVNITHGMSANELAGDIRAKIKIALQDHFDIDATLININSVEVMSSTPIYARANVELDGESVLIEFNETYLY